MWQSNCWNALLSPAEIWCGARIVARIPKRTATEESGASEVNRTRQGNGRGFRFAHVKK
jgi:hypothetical protein